MNTYFPASRDLDAKGFARTGIQNLSLAIAYFYFFGSTLAFDEDGNQWEKHGTCKVPEYFDRIEPVLWEPALQTAA